MRRIGDYTQLSDIYACGVTLYRLVNGDSNLPQVTPAQAHLLARRGRFPPRNGYRQFVPQALKRMINKAISVDPATRYQSAEEMRHALEHQHLCVDWEESQAPGRYVWIGKANNSVHYEVVKYKQRDKKWAVETRKGSDPNGLRRVGDLCDSDMRKQDADKREKNSSGHYNWQGITSRCT